MQRRVRSSGGDTERVDRTDLALKCLMLRLCGIIRDISEF
jgi:hypothetical protein